MYICKNLAITIDQWLVSRILLQHDLLEKQANKCIVRGSVTSMYFTIPHILIVPTYFVGYWCNAHNNWSSNFLAENQQNVLLEESIINAV